MGEKEHHVHFGGGSGVGKDNNIMIYPQRHGHLDAHLGFLQLHHRYHAEFSVPWNLCIEEEGKTLSPAVIVDIPNPNCRVIDFAHDKDGLRLKVELLAYKEKLLKEEIQVMCCKSGNPLKILLNARVLGKGKGTPLLRNGIRSIAIERDEDDETRTVHWKACEVRTVAELAQIVPRNKSKNYIRQSKLVKIVEP